jgi:hypothetical protein
LQQTATRAAVEPIAAHDGRGAAPPPADEVFDCSNTIARETPRSFVFAAVPQGTPADVDL